MSIKSINISESTIFKYVIYTFFAFLIFYYCTSIYKQLNKKVIESDAINYYAFLPGLIIENDLSFKFIATDPGKYSSRYWMKELENGNYVSKVTIGMAVMYSPFFLLSHLYALATDHSADGFSTPYRIGILLAALFYSLAGLLLLQKILIRVFDSYTSGITLLILFLGTNLFYYSTGEAGMSHVYSFFSITLLLYLIIGFYEKPGIMRISLIGIVYGLIVLIRPTNAIIAIMLPIWGVFSSKGIVERLRFWFVNNKIYIVFFTGGLFVILLPQILYWKTYTGSFFYNGYEDDGAVFHFLNPQILNSLFSYRKGWFLYTPVMVLLIPGLVLLFKHQRDYFWLVLIVLLLTVYLNSSWWLWWYGAGYGNRAYIDFYGIYAIAIAASIEYVLMVGHKRKLGKVIVITVTTLFVLHNLFQVAQYSNGALHMSGMTKEAYIFSFGRLYPKLPLKYLISEPDKELAAKGIYPKPTIPNRTAEDWINIYKDHFLSNPELMKMIEGKAMQWQEPIEIVLRKDAEWSYRKDFKIK